MATAAAYAECRIAAGDGLRVYAREYALPDATAVPVLCLAGLTRNAADFEGLAEHLRERRRVVCLDLPGRGRADRTNHWRRYDPRLLIDDVRHALAALGVHRALVVGTSLGGVLAAALGVVQPTLLAGVVFNDIGPDVGADGLSVILDVIGKDTPQADWSAAVAFLRARFPDLPAHDGEQWLKLARNTFRVGEDGLLHYDWDVGLVRPLRARLPDASELWRLFLACRALPCLVVRGETSRVFSPSCFAALQKAVPAWKYVTIAGVGHAPSLTEPPALEAIDELLERLDSRDPRRH
jgi:pimeloyl-ACP methyl ester carboxylesterase